MKIVIIGTLPSSLVNFRGQFISNLSKRGHTVVACASGATQNDIEKIQRLGAKYVDYNVERSGLNPFKDVMCLWSLYRIFKFEKPDVVLAYTIKPIIWGGIAAQICGVPRFSALVTGLGYVFQGGSGVRRVLLKIVQVLYRTALRKSYSVIFQNSDNLETFVRRCIIPSHKAFTINGSGVDLKKFKVAVLPKKMTFLLIARLLKDKGVREYMEAAEILKRHYPDVQFKLVGPPDPSPNGISLELVQNYADKCVIEYLGAKDDVRPSLSACSVYVLPSYHEGLPRSSLEAMATARPILTTNASGCKETVINGYNGWKVEVGDVEPLAERMEWFINNPLHIEKMGLASRKMVEDRFDVVKVNDALFKILNI